MKGLLSVTLAATLLNTAAAMAQSASPTASHPNAISQNSNDPAASDAQSDEAAGGQQTPQSHHATPEAPQSPDQSAPQPASDSNDASLALLRDAKSGCAAFVPQNIHADEVSWTGACDAGLTGGAGTLSLSYQGRFTQSFGGSFAKGVLQNGPVVIKWADGSHYEGDAVSAAMQGHGTLTTAAADRFEGEWKNGLLNGKGAASWSNGDRYQGEWRDGKAEGHGVQDWADGRQYNGEWHNDMPNGHGVIRHKDGNRFEGDFVDGEPDKLVQLAVAANTDDATASTDTAVSAPSPSADAHAPSQPGADASSDHGQKNAAAVQHSPIGGVAGKKLVAVDGSSLTLTPVEDGLDREIVAPNGSVKKNTFSFLADHVGAVSDGDDTDDVTGVFRLTDKGIVTNYSDGRTEQLYPNSGGGVSMTLNAPTGQVFCMAWYPEGHVFSLDERKAALAAYASKLGLDAPRDNKKEPKAAPKPTCGAVADAQTAPAVHTTAAAPKLIPQHPNRHQPNSLVHHAEASAHVVPASFATPSQPEGDHAIEVRPSTVHLIDGDQPAAQSASQTEAVASNAPAPAPVASASACLSVESDGKHWVFRNRCNYDLQFAYCLMNAHDPLASCDKGGVAGSVAPNGSSALVVDSSLSEKDADHDFRWVACSGGAGEVVAHLDRFDPPSGRCERRSAS